MNAPHHYPIHCYPLSTPYPILFFRIAPVTRFPFLISFPSLLRLLLLPFFSVLSSRPSRDALLRTGFLDLYHGCLVLHLIVECVTLESALMIPFKRTKRKKEEKQEETGSGGSRIWSGEAGERERGERVKFVEWGDEKFLKKGREAGVNAKTEGRTIHEEKEKCRRCRRSNKNRKIWQTLKKKGLSW